MQCLFLCLASFAYCNILLVCPCCSKLWDLFFYSQIILHCVHVLSFFTSKDRHQGCLSISAIVNSDAVHSKCVCMSLCQCVSVHMWCMCECVYMVFVCEWVSMCVCVWCVWLWVYMNAYMHVVCVCVWVHIHDVFKQSLLIGNACVCAHIQKIASFIECTDD